MQRRAEQHLVYGLQLGDREGIGDKRKRQRTAAAHIVAQCAKRSLHNGVVVEGEAAGGGNREKACGRGVAAGADKGRQRRRHERHEGDGDRAAPRVATGAAKDPHLLEQHTGGGEAGLFVQLAGRSVVEGLATDAALVDADEAAGQGALTEKGLATALDEQDLQHTVEDRQHDDVDGDRRSGDVGEEHDVTMPWAGPVRPRSGDQWWW